MFIEFVTDGQRIWLLILVALWAGLLFGGMVFGKWNSEGTHRTPTWARIGSSFTLVITGWSWFLFSRDTSVNTFALLIAIGMSLGAIGDLFMANLIRIKEPVLGGIAAFAMGHIVYITGFIHFGDVNGLSDFSPRIASLIFWWLMGFGGWYFVVYRTEKRSVLHYAALPYSLLLATTTGFATGLALQSPLFALLAVGTILFLLSDLLLAAQLFNGLHFTGIGDVVWILYGPAQMLIVYSVGAALKVIT